MGLSLGFYGQATYRGYRNYCIPVNKNTGNPIGDSIKSSDWMKKYHYSREQIKVLLRSKRIKGFKFKGTLYLLDEEPTELY